MKTQLRTQRENIIFNLYQKDIFESVGQAFESSLEEDQLKIFSDVLKNIDQINDMIESQLFNYTLNRLSFVDRAIIRFATYEFMFTETPVQVVIDEAIEITKEYTNLDDEKQHKFTNKLLDNIAKSVRE
ncbi:MAG: transcription antitermination factor NusB [Acholeplasmataceae bacterium]